MKRMVFFVIACLAAAAAYAQVPVCPQTQSCQNPCTTVVKCPSPPAPYPADVVTDLGYGSCSQGGSTFSCPAGQTVHLGESCCKTANANCPGNTCKKTCEPVFAASEPDHSPLTPTTPSALTPPLGLDSAFKVPVAPAAVATLDCSVCAEICRCHQHPDTKEVILFCAAP